MEFDKYIRAIDFSLSNMDAVPELSKLAYSIINNDNSFILSEEIINTCLANGILNTKLVFAIEDYTRFFYAVYYIEEKTKDFKTDDDWLDLFNYIGFPQHKTFREKVQYHHLNLIALIANRVKGVDILKIVSCKSEVQRHMVNCIFSTIPYLVSSTENTINAIMVAAEGIKPEDNYFELNKSIQKLAFKNLDFCQLLIDRTKEFPEKKRLLIPFAFVGLTNRVGISKTLHIVQELLKEDKIESQQLGLRCLSVLDNIDSKYDNVIADIQSLWDDIEKNGSDEVIIQLLYVYNSFKNYLPSSKQKIIDIGRNRNTRDILFAVTNISASNTWDKNFDKAWAENILNLSVLLKDQHIGTYRNIETILLKFLETDRNIVISYLRKFIEEKENDLRNIKGFKNLFIKINENNKDHLNELITVWLNNDNPRFHNSVHLVCSDLWIQGIKEISLDKKTIDTLSDYDLEFILMKIVGYIYSKEHLENLVYSILNRNKLSDYIKSLVIDLFCNHIVYNYGGTVNFLKQKKVKANKVQKEIIKSIIDYYNTTFGNKMKKPNELMPSEERMRISFQQKNLDKIDFKDNSKFKEPSIFDMVSKITIKIGGSFFMRNEYYGNKERYSDRTKSKLNYMSHSFELPSGEFVDPIGQKYLQYVWRTFKRRK